MRTKQSIFLDWNPSSEFWFHTDLMNDNDVDFIILNYLDNEAAPQSAIDFILKAQEKGKVSDYWANWYKVYGLGQIGNLEGVIFSNYQLIDTIPDDARLLGCGVDFGYSVDPTAIVEVYQYNDQRIIKEICYRTGMLNSDIAKVLPKGVPVYADSAEPKSIEEIRRFGISIKGVTKGKDSINYGIQVMQGQNYMITKDSTNLIKELRGYCWDKGKDGKTLPIPVGDDHIIDAWRYFEMESLGLKKNFGSYDIR
jgi:phage terminase large subunit